jgi:hypothetical protein
VRTPAARIQASDSSVYHKLLFTLKLDRWAKPLLGPACCDAVESRRKLSTSSGPKAVRIGTHQKRGRESGAHCACVLECDSAAPLLVLAQIWESSLNSDKKSANLFFL